MSDKGEPVRWITVKGARIPVFADGSIGVGTLDKDEKKEKNNPAWDKAVAKVHNAKEVWRIDREGFAVGISIAGDIFVGTGELGDTNYYKDTPENRKKAETYWQVSSFAREIKKKKR